MTDIFSQNADHQRQQARLGSELTSSITRAIEQYGSGVSFAFNGGECRCKVESGVATIDFVTKSAGLEWKLSACGGRYGEVSIAPTSESWYQHNRSDSVVNAVKDALNEALFNRTLRSALPTDVPLPATAPTIPERQIGTKEPFLEAGIEWYQLDNLLTSRGSQSLTFRTTSAEQMRRLGYNQSITISRLEDGSIRVEQSLPPRAAAWVGPRFEVPRTPGEPIIFFPMSDDQTTKDLRQTENRATLNEWFSRVKT